MDEYFKEHVDPETETKLRKLFDVVSNIDTNLVDRVQFVKVGNRSCLFMFKCTHRNPLQSIGETGLRITTDPRLKSISELSESELISLDFEAFSRFPFHSFLPRAAMIDIS